MLLLNTPVHGSGQHGQVAGVVAHSVFMVHVFAISFADAAGPLHFPAGGIALRPTLLLGR
jgi:hypothetical protein